MKKLKTTIKLPDELRKAVIEHCKRNNIHVSKLIENYLLVTILEDEECRIILKKEREK